MNSHPSSRFSSSCLPARSSAIALVMLFACTLALASTPQGTFTRTFQVSGPVDLEVRTRSGDITVRSGPAGTVSVRGKIFVSDHWLFGEDRRSGEVHEIEQNPPLRQQGNSIHIDTVNVRNISVDYEITVPAETSVRAHTGSGNETIEGMHGNADLQSGSGDMRLSRLTGDIRVQSGSGNLRAREISGPVHGGTGSGDVEVEETGSGDVDLHTGSGNITARGLNGTFRGETGSGDLTAEGRQTGSWEIRTGSGNVRVRLPSNSAFEADLSTSSGTLDINAPITMTVHGRVQETRKSIHGPVRGGGPVLKVHTGSGDIHIE